MKIRIGPKSFPGSWDQYPRIVSLKKIIADFKSQSAEIRRGGGGAACAPSKSAYAIGLIGI